MNYQMTELARRAEERCKGRFEEIDRIAFTCTEKVLEAFADRFDCELTFAEDCSYWFREEGEEEILNAWIREHI